MSRRKQQKPQVDFQLADHGSIWILTPITPAARVWIEDNVQQALAWGGGIAIEARFVEPIVGGIQADSLSIVGLA